MTPASLQTISKNNVTLLGMTSRPSGVCYAFTERTGGVSQAPYTGLNLGSQIGDDLDAVSRNRYLALDALDIAYCFDNLLCPNQVHGDTVVTVTSNESHYLADVRQKIAEGCDALVCTAHDVPVLLVYADCVPVILEAKGGFAVIHSGWRSTFARISALALDQLCDAAGVSPQEVHAYIGPHISVDDYEVSAELMHKFVNVFGTMVEGRKNHLNLSQAIIQTLTERGVPLNQIYDVGISTARHTDMFYSYRSEEGKCGRHGALACIPS